MASNANASELEKTLAALRTMGRFEEVDSALLQALRSMAAELDARPGNAQLWKQYLGALEELTADDGGSLDEDLENLFSASHDAPPA